MQALVRLKPPFRSFMVNLYEETRAILGSDNVKPSLNYVEALVDFDDIEALVALLRESTGFKIEAQA